MDPPLGSVIDVSDQFDPVGLSPDVFLNYGQFK